MVRSETGQSREGCSYRINFLLQLRKRVDGVGAHLLEIIHTQLGKSHTTGLANLIESMNSLQRERTSRHAFASQPILSTSSYLAEITLLLIEGLRKHQTILKAAIHSLTIKGDGSMGGVT